MKKCKKIILILLLIILILLILNKTVLAEIIDPNEYKPKDLDTRDASRIANMTGSILATIRNIGVISSVIVLSVIGLKYMLGSLEERAEYKEHMIPYIIGCLLLASATTIPSLVYNMLN
ncbi:MAG: pilin [Clostridia bacterium]|nr:pilin [Clostridia bacterium]